MTVTTSATVYGLDIAKSVFQLHGEDSTGKIVVQKRLARSQLEAFLGKLAPAVIGIEACGTSHFWARQIAALGHTVRLIPAAYVKAFVKRNKNDARDAAAICVAAGRPDMRAVPVKTIDQQAARSLEHSRDLLVRQHTQLANSLRGQMAERGIVAAQGRRGFAALREILKNASQAKAGETCAIPAVMAFALGLLADQIDHPGTAAARLQDEIMARARADPVMRNLGSIPGIGGLTAHAIVAAAGNGRQFACARDFAAWTGLTPKEHSSANRHRPGGISKMGDRMLRKLLALGASTIMRNARACAGKATPWQRGILARRPMKVAVLAQAAKTARIAWAVLVSGEAFRKPAPAAAA